MRKESSATPVLRPELFPMLRMCRVHCVNQCLTHHLRVGQKLIRVGVVAIGLSNRDCSLQSANYSLEVKGA